MPNTPYQPSWKKHEKDMYSEDTKLAEAASDAFIAEREKETKSNKKARDWEASRKKQVAKDKPLWVKQKREKENEDLRNFARSLKNAGVFKGKFEPCAGFIVVQVDEEVEKKTESGIIVAQNTEEYIPNTGTVLAVGDEMPREAQYYWPFPADAGKRVLFKKGAGLDVVIEGQKCRFMLFSEILGVFQ